MIIIEPSKSFFSSCHEKTKDGRFELHLYIFDHKPEESHLLDSEVFFHGVAEDLFSNFEAYDIFRADKES